MKTFIIGNSCSGKSFLAKSIAHNIPILHLDNIYWTNSSFTNKRSKQEIKKSLINFMTHNNEWVIEGVYIDFINEILNECNNLIFVDVTSETIIENANQRGVQQKDLAYILGYFNPQRKSENKLIYSQKWHQEIFDNFSGNKIKLKNRIEINNYIQLN